VRGVAALTTARKEAQEQDLLEAQLAEVVVDPQELGLVSLV
jgi:hypothetical protein